LIHFSRQHVRREKFFSAIKRASKASALQMAATFSEKCFALFD